MLLKKFQLTPKLDNIYPERFISNTMIENGAIQILDSFNKLKIKTHEPIINNFIEYIRTHIASIIKTFRYKNYGKIFITADSRYPLAAYVTDKKNFVINFQHKLSDYNPVDIMGIVIYGLMYFTTFTSNIKYDKLALYQIKLLSIMFMNLFGKKYGVFNEINSIEKSYLIFGAHVFVNFWGESYKNHYGQVIEHFNISKLDSDEIRKITEMDLNPKNFNVIKMVSLLDKELFNGINMNIIISNLSMMSLEVMTAFETLNRNLSLYLPSIISKQFGRNLPYILPEKHTISISIEMIRYFLRVSNI